MPKRRPLLQRESSDEEFETEAFRSFNKVSKVEPEHSGNEDDDIGSDIEELEESSNDGIDVNSDADGDGAEDEDDDAPEDVTFSASREEALSEVKRVMIQLKEEKLQVKDRRKKRDELYKDQKLKKMEALGRLPDDIVNSLPENLGDLPKKQKLTKTKISRSKKSLTEENNPENKSEVVSGDYIPLTLGFTDSLSGINAMPLNVTRTKLSVSQEAANFKHRRLYGNPGQRESTQQYLAKKKRKLASKPL